MLLTFLYRGRLTFNYSRLLWTLLSDSRSALNFKQRRQIPILCSSTRVCLAISLSDGHSVLQINLSFFFYRKKSSRSNRSSMRDKNKSGSCHDHIFSPFASCEIKSKKNEEGFIEWDSKCFSVKSKPTRFLAAIKIRYKSKRQRWTNIRKHRTYQFEFMSAYDSGCVLAFRKRFCGKKERTLLPRPNTVSTQQERRFNLLSL